ncbi:hypothetical protein GCK32_012265 [Trichostrongylus colubriformis]|uniref:Uncharacterized protein n=1 Tax=Trichostrongylus colubriformis TaxID=6319 RepID=A0AAN8EUM2_TRICO
MENDHPSPKMFYSVNLDPYRDRLNEIDVSFLIPLYEKFYNFIKKNIKGKNISYFTCGTDQKAKESLARGKWNTTLPGIFKTTPQVIQLMKDLPKIRRKFFQDSTALNDFRAIKSEGRKYLLNHVGHNSPPCMLAIAWNNDGFGWCHVIPLALERVFIGSVAIALAAMLLTKLSFDTVDFIPFVPPSAQEVAMTKSEANLLTAEPLRFMPSLTNVSILGSVNAKELAKKKDREKPTQEIHSDSREDFVPPTKGEPAQDFEKVKKPVQRRSVYSNDARTARLPVKPPKSKRTAIPRPGQEDVTMDDDEVDVFVPASPHKKEPDEPRRSDTGLAVIAPTEKPPSSPQDPDHISSNYM